MTTKEWLKKEGYQEVMTMTDDNLAIIIDRYIREVASKNFIQSDVSGSSQPSTLRWNLWKDSEEGQTAHDYETLTEEKYLHNRIYRAFMAGANFR